MKTTCKLKYQLFGMMAYCSLDFFGANKRSYEEEWLEIEFEKYSPLQKEIEELRTQKQELLNNPIFKKRSFLAQIFHIAGKKEEKIIQDILILQNNIKKLEDKRFFSTSELLIKAEEMLSRHSFVLTNSNSSEVSTTDIYKLNV